MPYDPYSQANPWWQQQAPTQGAQFAQPPAPQQKKEWWQGLPTVKPGQFANRPGQSANSPDDANSANPSPSLMQMLMLGGKPTYSGTPSGGSAPSGSYGAIPPWAWLSGIWGSPGGGGGSRP